MPKKPVSNNTGNSAEKPEKIAGKINNSDSTLGVHYRTLVEQVPAIIYTDSAEKMFQTLYISPQLKTVTGYEPEEWINDNTLWENMIHPDDRERVLEEYTRTYAS